ncbi:MAG: 3-hydroxyacyl-CoA dehydrogenase NAD-binding domain-containing protein [Pseudomonadota bacterium]
MDPKVAVKVDGDIAWVTIDSPPVNATSAAVRRGLLEAVEAVQGSRIAVLACAGKTFIAGGDMSEFDAPPVLPHLPDVVDAIEKSPTPFVAMLHGTVLGGGLEIAMACAARVAKPGTRFGLPEVHMGIIPGAGGTQRAPRLLGWQISVDMACMGQLKTADEMLAAGAIDAVSDEPKALIPGWSFPSRPPVSERPAPPLTAEDQLKYSETVAAKAKGRQAPPKALEALFWAQEPFSNGQRKERALHLDMRNSEESVALRHVFFAERRVAKPKIIADVAPAPVKHIAIVGGGLMGSGISTACLNAGYKVTVIEQDRAAAETARETVDRNLKGGVKRGKFTEDEYQARLTELTTTDSYADAAEADLAIEAVFEDLTAKQRVFESLASVLPSSAILATNTSYLDPNDIFQSVEKPARCLGLHFFSPANIMKLVEVVRAEKTAPETLATGFTLARSMGKIPVLSGICEGFIGNRILAAYRRAGEYMLADGAMPHEIDGAMRVFGMAMGPFEVQDQAGLQIAHDNRRRQDATRPAEERYIPLLDQICEMGRFGQRSGAGWYSYAEDSRKPERDPVVEKLIRDYSDSIGITRRHFTADEIQTQLLAAMANEGAKIVAEGIAESPAAVDVVKTAGYGFPRWRGGPMHWADSVGAPTISRALTELETASPNSWTRADIFKDEKVPSI